MRFTYSLKRVREVRKFHVSIVQRRLINLQKSVIHVQSCCFANTKKVLVIKNTKYFFVVLKREATKYVCCSQNARGYTSVWKLRNYINDKIKKKNKEANKTKSLWTHLLTGL